MNAFSALKQTSLRLTVVVTALVFGITYSAIPARATDPGLQNCDAVVIAAHRGSVDSTHTENTLRSYNLAISRHADMIEGDMHLTKDNQWVMMHDDTVDRTTSGTGTVASKTLSQIKQIRTDDGVLSGIPSTNAVLYQLRANKTIRYQFEVKSTNATTAQLQTLLNLFNQYGVKDRMIITAFGGAPLLKIKAIDPTWNTALIAGSQVAAATVKQYGDTFVVNASAINSAYVSELHAAGISTYPYTVDTQSVWTNVVKSGVDGVITGKVNYTISWCNQALATP